MRLQGKVALISGGARGQGAAEAKLFASEGAKVVIGDILEAEGRQTEAEINEAGGDCIFVRLDVTSESGWQDAVGATVTRFGKLDVLVNNAGVVARGILEDTTSEEWDRVMDVNAKGVFLGTKAAIPEMRKAGGGSIINIASIGSIAPRPGVTPYNATKGAVLTMTKGLALEVARNQIRVNAVNPVASLTGFMETATGVPAEEMSEEQKARLVATIPLGRMAEPTDVAGAVAFLASDDAVFLTGTSINVDGGRSI